MTITKVRSLNYKAGRILGDVRAVQTGRVGRRVGRRIAGRYSGRAMHRMFK